MSVNTRSHQTKAKRTLWNVSNKQPLYPKVIWKKGKQHVFGTVQNDRFATECNLNEPTRIPTTERRHFWWLRHKIESRHHVMNTYTGNSLAGRLFSKFQFRMTRKINCYASEKKIEWKDLKFVWFISDLT